jgi:hypothetical protein
MFPHRPAALLSGEQSTGECELVYGLGENPQRILPAPLFVILLMLLFPLAVYLPTHLLFARIFRAAAAFRSIESSLITEVQGRVRCLFL